jgi:hypothetical protein
MNNLAMALIKAQKEMSPLMKDKKGNFGLYSTLASVQDVCLPALGNHGIAVFQSVSTDWEGNSVFVRVSCILIHAESGEQWTPDPLLLVPAKTDPQGIGSAITYGRRYALMAVAGIAPEDDDGQLASTGTVQAPNKQNMQRPQQPPQAPQKPAAPSSNGHTQLPAFDVDKLIAGWTAPADAKNWAVDAKLATNEFSANNSFKKIVKDDFGGACTTANVKDIFRAFATHYLNKPVEQVKETA